MTDTHNRPFLSLIIPARNEENRLPPTLARVLNYLRQQPYRAEVLVVENGSTDNTSSVVEEFIAHHLGDDDKVTMRLLHSSPAKVQPSNKG
ncbi:MAG: glycosyltransferase [Caldilineaceae bacterium]|nr:glycosyltransferase [Caldilineaceae bacterium]